MTTYTDIKAAVIAWAESCPTNEERIAIIASTSDNDTTINLTTALHYSDFTLTSIFSSLFKDPQIRDTALMAIFGGHHAK